ncbi:uncharacterized protein LOC118450392 [Vespa mandarinia]|uniref:uncharacterized protein LOC118450392 n=1 Tax=Vespa mandarinia TaxID=7446 RepID=UPI00160BD594|nr:uncharacterized protein LOC118450392 [Vespa mandarinia]XP_035742055.1 uncharacterized protein LOC118450392 [Vespa mandarinia]XP_035742056.1 uncharacterized protein LOC118450392 [Vespa mandarinia]XP_035742057.1 uncharacterized protein LOC118450392 [Vespa mandarinia]
MSKLKFAAFTKIRPDLWFIMAEADFTTFGIIYDKVKYLTVLKALISDMIQQEPATDETMLPNRTPQLLRQIRELADGFVDDSILQQLWLERIPTYIKTYMITTSKLLHDPIAENADRFYELMPYVQHNNQVMYGNLYMLSCITDSL